MSLLPRLFILREDIAAFVLENNTGYGASTEADDDYSVRFSMARFSLKLSACYLLHFFALSGEPFTDISFRLPPPLRASLNARDSLFLY